VKFYFQIFRKALNVLPLLPPQSTYVGKEDIDRDGEEEDDNVSVSTDSGYSFLGHLEDDVASIKNELVTLRHILSLVSGSTSLASLFFIYFNMSVSSPILIRSNETTALLDHSCCLCRSKKKVKKSRILGKKNS
jgi:hypothetical protein